MTDISFQCTHKNSGISNIPFSMNAEVVPVHRVQRNLEKNDYIVICGTEIYYAKKIACLHWNLFLM